MSLISFKNAKLGYKNKLVVDNLTIDIQKGDFLCVLGSNGSGKTTFVRSLVGLTPLLEGSIEFADSFDRKAIGYLPQQTSVQSDFPASAYEVVISGCLNKCGLFPFYSAKQKEYANEIMKSFGIDRFASHCFRELSGGQQQRVLLARAICASSELLILDEPITGLDPQTTEEMYCAISKLNQKVMTVIMISHDTDKATKYASKILHLSRRFPFYGKTEDYLKSDVFVRTREVK